MLYYALGIVAYLLLIIGFQHRRLRFPMTERTKSKLQIITILPLLLISSFRWNVGTDTWHTYTPEYLAMKAQYTDLSEEEKAIMVECSQLNAVWDGGLIYDEAEEIDYEEAYSAFSTTYKHTAIGFQFLERILIFFNADVQWLYIVTSLIILAFTYASIRMQGNNLLLAGLFFVITGNFFLSLNIVSQYIAISICIFSCYFIENKKPIYFILTILLASTFHISALIFLPTYFLSKINIKPTWCALAVILSLLIGNFAFPLIQYLITIIAPKYVWYLSWDSDFEWIFFGLNLAVFIVSSYYFEKGKDKPYFKLYFYLNVLGMIALAFSGNIPLLKRINYYFASIHFLFLPIIIWCEEKIKLRRLLLSTIIVLYILETIISVSYLNKNGVLPYKVFFEADRIQMTDDVYDSFGK